MATYEVCVNATYWNIEAASMTDAFRIVLKGECVWPEDLDEDEFFADIEIRRTKG